MGSLAPLFLLAGGPGAERQHVVALLRLALTSSSPGRKPVVAYVGAASDDDAWFFARMAGLLSAAGAERVDLAPLCQTSAAKIAQQVIKAADLIFVSGGDVEAGMRVLNTGPGAGWLRSRFEAGVPFVGLSAGGIMLGREWITWDDPEDDGSASRLECLGFAPVICDAHSEADDWQELRALLALSSAGTVGHGITMPAMLQVDADGSVAVHGGEVIRFEQQADGTCARRVLKPTGVG